MKNRFTSFSNKDTDPLELIIRLTRLSNMQAQDSCGAEDGKWLAAETVPSPNRFYVLSGCGRVGF